MEKTKGKVTLSGFDIPASEKAIVNRLLKTYLGKIGEKVGYKEIRLDLKKSRKGKAYLHQIKARLITPDRQVMRKNKFDSKAVDYNLFAAIDTALEKLLREAEHKKRRYMKIKKEKTRKFR